MPYPASAAIAAEPEVTGRLVPLPHGVTPRLDLDVTVAVARLRQLADALPGTAIHYAVKANPHPVLLRELVRAGASFDVASPREVALCLAAGARAEDLVYSNPVKRRADLAEAYRSGIRVFAFDSMPELVKLAEEAPGSAVLCRLLTSGQGSDWPLSRKYGAPAAECLDLLRQAHAFGLDAAGVTFHVGSQQHDPRAWDAPIATAAQLFSALRAYGVEAWLLDLGGGFPARLAAPTPGLGAFGRAIDASLTRHFGASRPRTLAEPGRALVAEAGVLVASVVEVCWRGGRRWVYLDAGVFTGLVETLDEAIRYRIETAVDGGPTGPVVLAGPTCDSADVMYERDPVHLPLALAEGDEVRILAAGAYTACYSTVGFNGFDPLPTRLVGAGVTAGQRFP